MLSSSARRQSIVDAIHAIAREKPLTVDNVATAAGCSPSLVKHYVGGATAIYVASLPRVEQRQWVKTAVASEIPRWRLQRLSIAKIAQAIGLKPMALLEHFTDSKQLKASIYGE